MASRKAPSADAFASPDAGLADIANAVRDMDAGKRPKARPRKAAKARKPEKRTASSAARKGTTEQPYVRKDGSAVASTSITLPVGQLRALRIEAAGRGVPASVIVSEALSKMGVG